MNLNIKTNDKNHLDIGGADAVDIAEEFGTPTFVIDESRIRDNYNRFYSAFSKYYPDFKVFYACKANTNLTVMKILESEAFAKRTWYNQGLQSHTVSLRRWA